LSIFVALLARARPLRVSPSACAFKNQQLPFSGHHGIYSTLSIQGKLVALGENPEKTHNLPYLITRIGTHGHDLEWFRTTAEFLSYEYLAERYPGDFDPPPTDSEASEALKEVAKLFDHIEPR